MTITLMDIEKRMDNYAKLNTGHKYRLTQEDKQLLTKDMTITLYLFCRRTMELGCQRRQAKVKKNIYICTL